MLNVTALVNDRIASVKDDVTGPSPSDLLNIEERAALLEAEMLADIFWDVKPSPLTVSANYLFQANFQTEKSADARFIRPDQGHEQAAPAQQTRYRY